MKHVIVSIVMVFVMLFIPSPAFAAQDNLCTVQEIVQICDLPLVGTLIPTQDVPIPPVVVPPVKVPGTKPIVIPPIIIPPILGTPPRSPQKPPRGNGSSGPVQGVITINRLALPATRQALDSTPRIPKDKVKPVPHERIVIIKTKPIIDRKTIYQFKTYPWYFWATIIFTILAAGWLMFYDTEPKDDEDDVDKSKSDPVE